MVDNYPSTWTQGSANGKMSNVLQFYQHNNPNVVENSLLEQNTFLDV